MSIELLATTTNRLESGAQYSTKIFDYNDYSIELNIWGASVYSPFGVFLQNFRFRPHNRSLLDLAQDYINHRIGE